MPLSQDKFLGASIIEAKSAGFNECLIGLVSHNDLKKKYKEFGMKIWIIYGLN